MPSPRVSVVIVTWLRPAYIRACLEHLAQLDPLPDQVLVVDASADGLTAEVVDGFEWAERIAFPGGAGHMTTARNVGLLHASGELIAFIDDDANVRSGWLSGLVGAFADPDVAAVAGRTCNGLPGEDQAGIDAIGQILPDGSLTANFAADPGGVIAVDHGIGANMAFRRDVLARLGGFRDDFAGAGLCEDTDMFMRIRALGARVVFAPEACVDHVGAPHVKGRRFDYRYQFWMRRNHALLLARGFGFGSRALRAWAWRELSRPDVGEGSLPRRAARVGLAWCAVSAGLLTSLPKAGWRGSSPERRDRTGEEIRSHLAAAGGVVRV
jgi:GT2 family glycosyltransferase